MKIAFFSFGIMEQGGGYENFVVSNSSGMKSLHPDTDITIVTCSDKLDAKLQSLLSVYYFKKQSKKQIHREALEDIQASLKGVGYIKVDSFKELRAELQKYDVVHIKNEILELSIIAWLGYNSLPPLITGIHTPIFYPSAKSIQAKLHNALYDFYYKRYLKYFSAAYVQNSEELLLMEDRFNFKNVRFIHQALDMDQQPVVANADKELRVLFLGRLSEEKGINHLIEIMQSLNKKQPGKFAFKVAGEGDPNYASQLKELDKANPNISYLGHTPHNKVSSLYSWCDVTLIPSQSETLCKIAIEAAVHGKLSVVSDIPGPREIIENEVTGFLLPLNPTNFINRLIFLQTQKSVNPQHLTQMGKAAQERVMSLFDREKAYEKLYGVFMSAYEINSR